VILSLALMSVQVFSWGVLFAWLNLSL
jgi:hypothetical protein